MKIFCLLLCLLITQVLAERVSPEINRLAMGLYYPALTNVSNKTDIEITLNYWMQEISLNRGLGNTYSVLYDDILKMSTDFHQGKLDLVFAPALLLAIHFDRALLSDGFAGVQQLNKQDYVLIIAQQDFNLFNINYLEKRLQLPANDLFAKIFVETEVIKQHHLPNQRVFSEIKTTNKNQRIILDIFFGKADIGVVTESTLDLMIEMNPQIKKKIQIIKKFTLLSHTYAYFNRDYRHQKMIKEEAFRLMYKPRGRQILEVFKTTAIKETLVDDLKQFELFYQAYQKLKTTLANE